MQHLSFVFYLTVTTLCPPRRPQAVQHLSFVFHKTPARFHKHRKIALYLLIPSKLACCLTKQVCACVYAFQNMFARTVRGSNSILGCPVVVLFKTHSLASPLGAPSGRFSQNKESNLNPKP